MKPKSYCAGTFEQALNRASKEIAPDAMLVYSREAHAEAGYLGSNKVPCAAPETSQPAGSAPAPLLGSQHAILPPPRVGKSTDEASVERLSSELTGLRGQMERMIAASTRRSVTEGTLHAGLMAALDPLLQVGISEEIVDRLAIRLSETPEALLPDGVELGAIRALRRELGAMFPVDSRLGTGDGGSRYVALIGPPGAGKTATLVKLAVAYVLKFQRPVQLISMDTVRVGGTAQLRAYAVILGVGFQELDTTGTLAQALEEHRYKDLVLIDTPGLSEKDMDAAENVTQFLASRPDVDTHLTLTASMKPADLRRAVDRYGRFRPAKLLFTKVDETDSLGTIINEAVRTAKPVSFLATGQRIPEDIEGANKDRLVDLILGCQVHASMSPCPGKSRDRRWAVPICRREPGMSVSSSSR